MKSARFFSLPLILGLSMALAAQTRPPASAGANNDSKIQESEELSAIREKFSEVLDSVNKAWFGEPYQQIRAVDLRGNIAIVFSSTAVEDKIAQLTQGAYRGGGTQTGQAFGTLTGTYFANGDHLYNINGDFGTMRFQRMGARGFWYIRDQNVYTTNINLAPPDAPITFMGWFASVMSDIKDVYVKGATFRVSKGADTTVGGKAAQSVIFNAPTAPYDPTKREQPASDTFGFWKKGRLEIAYDPSTKQPLRMSFSNTAQGIEAVNTFTYDANGRIRQIDINNRSKKWEGPAFVRAIYGTNGMISAISGELRGQTHKITFDLATTWNKDKATASIQGVVPPIATKLGREDMELRLAMMLASKVGDMQKMGFNFMAPKVSAAAVATAATAAPAAAAPQRR
jgi:hypothetical protein